MSVNERKGERQTGRQSETHTLSKRQKERVGEIDKKIDW